MGNIARKEDHQSRDRLDLRADARHERQEGSSAAWCWIVEPQRTAVVADISAWGWLDRAARVLKGADDPLGPYPHLKQLLQRIDARPAAARAVGNDHNFKKVNDEETQRALFPSNYPAG
jgi:hypothetical protein